MRKTLTLLPIAILVAACTTGASSPSPLPAATPGATPSPAAPSSPADTAEPSQSAGEATIQLADSNLGEIVVDAEGRTLYVFLNDTDGTSTCYDQCATNWPPLIAEGELSAGEGLDDSDIATTPRTDGSMQVTYFGKPLYYFAPDTAPGDTKGQGVGGVWFVLGANGQEIR